MPVLYERCDRFHPSDSSLMTEHDPDPGGPPGDWSDCFIVASGATSGIVVLRVHVQPRAGRSGVVGRHGDALKIRVSAPPVDDRANAAVVELVAGLAGVAPSAVTVVGGGRSRAKRVRIEGVGPGPLSAAIDAAVAARL
jgi:uncharacterized protein (TIGR00251 family)